MRTAVAIPPAQATEAAGLAQIAIIKGLAQLGRGMSDQLATHYGSARVQKAVSAMNTADDAAAVDTAIIVSAFVQQLRNQSAFYRLLDGMIRIPFRTRASMIAADATGWIINEGNPIPLTRVTLDNLRLEPKMAAALLVLTEELLRSTKAEQNITLALRRAVTAAVDGRFFGTVIDVDTPTIPSAGNTAADAVADIKALLDAVAPKTESVTVFAMSPEVQRAASLLTNVSGNFQFPDLTPTGGSILGIPVLPSDQIGAGRVALMDASGMAGESGTISVDASDQADINMAQDDTGAAATSALTSMWHTNSVAIRAVIEFDAALLRDDAVAVLTGVEWSNAAP